MQFSDNVKKDNYPSRPFTFVRLATAAAWMNKIIIAYWRVRILYRDRLEKNAER